MSNINEEQLRINSMIDMLSEQRNVSQTQIVKMFADQQVLTAKLKSAQDDIKMLTDDNRELVEKLRSANEDASFITNALDSANVKIEELTRKKTGK